MNQIQDQPRALADLASAERVLASFGHSERIEALLVERLEGLIEAIPRLHAWRGFSGGAWVIGARTSSRISARADTRTDAPAGAGAGADAPPVADEPRTTRADYSRIDFEIRIDAEAGRAEAVCRSTIRSRDRRTEQVAQPLDESGLAHLAAWFETMLLAFGQQYFEPASGG